MITKLKWLKAYFTRTPVPAAGVTVGKVLYTAKNEVGRRQQYAIDLDANNMDIQTIDEVQEGNTIENEIIAMPGVIVTSNNTFAPQNDKSLYLVGNKKAIYSATQKVTVPLEDGTDGALNVLNVLTGDTIDGEAVTLVNCTLTELTSDAPLTLNLNGSVDLAALTPAGDYVVTYRLTEIADTTNTYDGFIQITVDEV